MAAAAGRQNSNLSAPNLRCGQNVYPMLIHHGNMGVEEQTQINLGRIEFKLYVHFARSMHVGACNNIYSCNKFSCWRWRSLWLDCVSHDNGPIYRPTPCMGVVKSKVFCRMVFCLSGLDARVRERENFGGSPF